MALVDPIKNRTKNRNASRAFRARNKRAGLCACGNERLSIEQLDGDRHDYKTCAGCLSRTRSKYLLRVRGPLPAATIAQKSYVTLRTDVEPDLIARFYALCTQYDMTVAQAVEDALEMYIEATERNE